jgi:hypothetical protein
VSPGLWLLLGLHLRGWVRSAGRSLRTARGALLVVLSALVMAAALGPALLLPRDAAQFDPDALRRNGPAFLLVVCLINLLAYSGERTIYFTPAEVSFLFTGPFGRREILGYKALLTFLVGLPSGLLLAACFRAYSPSFLSAVVGVQLMILFMQLFGMALGQAAAGVGARLYGRGRRLVLLGLVLFAGVLLLQAGGLTRERDVAGLVADVTHTPLWQALTQPLRWFFDAFLAERLWPDLAASAAKALGVDAVLLLAVFALDADSLEATAASSARAYAQLQRFRRGEVTPAGGGRPRFSVPGPPYWGGVGPVFWRQLTTGVRGLGRLLLVLGAVGALASAPLWLGAEDRGGEYVRVVGGSVFTLAFFFTPLVPFDFRGDVDRMATLKVLPVRPWRLAVGQLLTPVLLMTAFEWALLGLLAAAFRPERVLLGFAAFAPPLTFLLFALENLLFLWFPTRVTVATPGDFQSGGRNILLMLGRAFGLGAAAGVAIVVGVAAGALALVAGGWAGGGSWSAFGRPVTLQETAWGVGLAAAWAALALSGACLVPLIALAFAAFDVGRDTPP